MTEIIQLMADNETLIGQLYRLYAQRFPAEKAFFLSIASEEDNHHDWIINIARQAAEQNSPLKLKTFTTLAIKAYQNYMLQEMQPEKIKNLNLHQALSISLYIEKSLLEKHFLDVFKNGDPKLENITNSLVAATTEHAKRVQDKLSGITQRD
ncbi:hypothetical protein [Dehalococcoides mccartyi]|uniref:Rubrerythrin diiron-binding domain-containing protein n=1 Tax=Dehalococcoides mccartyi (strain VS) TaxID=311424 RepID=D2BIQ5_DEHMV|nr:hypothetical protein [Dehalococcoides mccartyi]ACZ62205.1 hypothetical protein DhcVS_1088 [Dehalococcoides mccartyi VS]